MSMFTVDFIVFLAQFGIACLTVFIGIGIVALGASALSAQTACYNVIKVRENRILPIDSYKTAMIDVELSLDPIFEGAKMDVELFLGEKR